MSLPPTHLAQSLALIRERGATMRRAGLWYLLPPHPPGFGPIRCDPGEALHCCPLSILLRRPPESAPSLAAALGIPPPVAYALVAAADGHPTAAPPLRRALLRAVGLHGAADAARR